MKQRMLFLSIVAAIAIPTFAMAQQTVSDLGRPTNQMRENAQQAYNANPMPTTASTAPPPVTPQDNQVIRSTVGTPTMTGDGVRLGNGTVVRYQDIAPQDKTGEVASLENVNGANVQQRTVEHQNATRSDTSVSAQAYRTSTVTSQRAVRYGAQSSVAGYALPNAENDPANLPGTVGFSPNLYFGGTSPFVTVRVVLTGGYGPASIRYSTTGGTASGSWYQPVHGTLSWGAGQGGMRSFRVPIDVAAVSQARGSGEVDLVLTGASGASLKGAAAGRILLEPKLAGYKVPVCGGANGMACPGMGGVLPVNPLPVGTPPSSTPVTPPRRRPINNPCDPNWWRRTRTTPPIECR